MFCDISVKNDMYQIKATNSKSIDKPLCNCQNYAKTINTYESTTKTSNDRVSRDRIPQNRFPQER